MILVGIDVAKDKHDCFICNSDGEVLFNAFLSQTIWMASMTFSRRSSPCQMILIT